TPSGHIPFTPRAKKVLELSLREALQLGHNYIGTEHILLGLLREGEGTAVKVLSRSEEHTSELQSRFDLVCRLLLEKKNETTKRRHDRDVLRFRATSCRGSLGAAAIWL